MFFCRSFQSLKFRLRLEGQLTTTTWSPNRNQNTLPYPTLRLSTPNGGEGPSGRAKGGIRDAVSTMLCVETPWLPEKTCRVLEQGHSAKGAIHSQKYRYQKWSFSLKLVRYHRGYIFRTFCRRTPDGDIGDKERCLHAGNGNNRANNKFMWGGMTVQRFGHFTAARFWVRTRVLGFPPYDHDTY